MYFISHATVDDFHADRLADALAAHGLQTWIDHRGGIEPGTPNWERAITQAINSDDCAALILLMTPESLASDICSAECLLARELSKPIFVAKLRDCAPEMVWLFIKMIQWADLRADFDAGAARLIRALGGERDPDLPTPTASRFIGAETMRAFLPYLTLVPLIGRSDDVNALLRLLKPGVTVQMTAVGGTGKSRIAAEIARMHPIGAIWHRCDETSAAYQLTDALRRFYGLEDTVEEKRVFDRLDRGAPLIVIDQAEAVEGASERRRAYAAWIARAQAHNTSLMLTGRAPWDEIKPKRQHSLAPLSDEEAGAQIALEYAAADAKALAHEDAPRLARAARLHAGLIEVAIGQLPERPVERVIKLLDTLQHDDMQAALDEMIRRSVAQMPSGCCGG